MKFKFTQILTYFLLVNSSAASQDKMHLGKAFERLVPSQIDQEQRTEFLEKIDYIGDASKRYFRPQKHVKKQTTNDHPAVQQDAEENVWDADDTVDPDDIFKVDAGDAIWDNEEPEEGAEGAAGSTTDNRRGNWRQRTGEEGTRYVDSAYLEFLSLKFSFGEAEDLVAGFSFQLIDDVFLYNAQDCTFWAFDVLTDLLNGALLFIEDDSPMRGIKSFAYAFHKAPIAIFTCDMLADDYTSIVGLYTTIQGSVRDWNQGAVTVFWYTFFNLVDLIYEFITLYYAFVDREWTEIGTYLAKIISDIFFKAPFLATWTYKNSDVINENWGNPLDPWNGFIHEINYLLAYFDADQINLGEFQSSDATVKVSELDQDKSAFNDKFVKGNGDTNANDFENQEFDEDDSQQDATGDGENAETNAAADDPGIQPPAFDNSEGRRRLKEVKRPKKKLTEAERQIKEHDRRTEMVLKLAACVKENPDKKEIVDKAKSLVEDWKKLNGRMFIKVDQYREFEHDISELLKQKCQ